MDDRDIQNAWLPKPWKVIGKTIENDNTVSLSLTPCNSHKLDIKAGQFHMLYSFGIGEIPISFSQIASSSVSHTIRNVGAVSKSLASKKIGDVVGVRGPFGSYWPLEEAFGKDLLIIAGGLGIAPLKPVIEDCIKHRGKFERVSLIYGARDPDQLIFKDLYDRCIKAQIETTFTVDAAQGKWPFDIGFVTEYIRESVTNPQKTRAFICGPEIMMRFCLQKLISLDIEAQHVFLSMERSMKCALGYCGHCQLGPHFVCKDGPVFKASYLETLIQVKEV